MQTLVDTTIHTTISVADLPWEDIAACRAVPNAADLFFSEDIGDIAAANAVRRLFGVGRVPRSSARPTRVVRRVGWATLHQRQDADGEAPTGSTPEGRPSGGPDAGRADSGASAGHRPEAVRLSPSQTRWRGRPPDPATPRSPHRPARLRPELD